MAVLDEFKKQLVQDLVRYMIEENEPRDQMWARLKDQYGWDCKLLWERIRILTVKKLSKMLAAEDRTEFIPSIAQMTPNDWLVFDKILVHENIDVIGKDLILSGHPESKVLWELFILVSSYHIESLPTEELAKGWYNLTKVYNTSGRYCSAMLLQLRWYQLKDLVRTNFHNFWSIYHGKTNFKNQVTRASKLQKLIASKYGNILTEPFTPWEGLIKKKLNAQNRDLENCGQLDKSELNDDVDVIEIKPTIETIDLDSDSENEDELKHNRFQVTNAEEKQPISDINVISDVIKKVDERKTVEENTIADFKYEKCEVQTGKQYGQVKTEKDDKLFILKHEIVWREENNSVGIIDPKLLMIAICDIKKLDDIVMDNSTNYTKISNSLMIRCIEAANKPKAMKSVAEDKEKTRQNLIKPKYTLKKFQNNPDFNIKLKNLSVNFFLNERNRRLFNDCRPVTVNIDGLNETQSDSNETQNNKLLASASCNKDIIGKIEVKNGFINIIPRHEFKKKTTDIRNKRKYIVDLTDNCDSRQTKRKAIIFL